MYILISFVTNFPVYGFLSMKPKYILCCKFLVNNVKLPYSQYYSQKNEIRDLGGCRGCSRKKKYRSGGCRMHPFWEITSILVYSAPTATVPPPPTASRLLPQGGMNYAAGLRDEDWETEDIFTKIDVRICGNMQSLKDNVQNRK